MSQFPHINLPLRNKLTFTANPVSVVPLPNGEMLMNFASQPLITKLNANLEIIWEKIMQGQNANYVSSKLSASSDGRLIAIAGMTDIRILDTDAATIQHTVEHGSWSWFLGAACYFTKDNTTIWYVLPGDENVTDELQVMHTATFEVIASYPLLESQRYTYAFHATPDNDIILLEAAAGQEESILMKLYLDNGSISLTKLPQCNDVIMGNFAPSGKEFTIAPHYDGPLEIYSFPEILKVAEQDQEAIFEGSKDFPASEPDNINYSVIFVDDNNILVVSQFGRLLLLERASLRCKAEVMPEGIEFTAYKLDGNPTTNPDYIFDYSSNIINVMIVHNKLLLTTNDGQLRSYDLPV
ncbi:hypothetical protein KTO58_11775 [Chitinophaga pendula]|uniref:hypothetical protein n=1 Tax=Chitinophaga TaxID=79328 RepID=UPI000BAEF085|nr:MULTISPECIES: hypothetical protein [Chitinophaga]ASZ12555.1 hypothetical protein CK934_17115 [Chitinophaga sp. MD30]UCJ09842.1 hypothetical protein KTO58_11775 [Chitinophaga pendula]